VGPQDSQNCALNFAKRKQSDAEFAGNTTHIELLKNYTFLWHSN